MAIYGTGYRTLSYQPTPIWRRLWAVAREELRVLFRRRWGIVVYVICLMPTIFSLLIMLARIGVWPTGMQRSLQRMGGASRTN